MPEAISTPSPKPVNPIEKVYPQRGPEDTLIQATYDASNRARAQEANKARPFVQKILGKNKVSPQDIARTDLQRLEDRAREVLTSRGVEPSEQNLSWARREVVHEFRPKKPTEIHYQAFLQREGGKAIQALEEGNWKGGARLIEKVTRRFYPDKRLLDTFLSQASASLHKQVAEVVKAKDTKTFLGIALRYDHILSGEHHLDVTKLPGITPEGLRDPAFFDPIEQQLAERISAGRLRAFEKQWNLLECTKLIKKEQLKEFPLIVKASAQEVGRLLKLSPVWEIDVKDRLVFFERFGLPRDTVFDQSGAVGIIGGQIRKFLQHGSPWESDVKAKLAFSRDIGMDKKSILAQATATGIIASQVQGFLKQGTPWESDIEKRLAFARSIGVDPKEITRQSGAEGIGAQQIADLLKRGSAWQGDVIRRLLFLEELDLDSKKILQGANAVEILVKQVANFIRLGNPWKSDRERYLAFAQEIGLDPAIILQRAEKINQAARSPVVAS